jgi:K+-sensing histidine kinase KdpD
MIYLRRPGLGQPPSAVPEGSAIATSSAKQRSQRILRWVLLTILPSLAAFTVQLLLWSMLSPFAWFLLYPTVLISSWFGGFGSGLVATGLSTVLVWWAFLPYKGLLRIEDPTYVVSTLVFLPGGWRSAWSAPA